MFLEKEKGLIEFPNMIKSLLKLRLAIKIFSLSIKTINY